MGARIIIRTIAGRFVMNAMSEETKSQDKSTYNNNCDNEDEDLGCFPNITNLFHFSSSIFTVHWFLLRMAQIIGRNSAGEGEEEFIFN